jgi:hypothetical protein
MNRAVKLRAMNKAQWLTVREFAVRVGLAASTLRNQIRRGEIAEARMEETPVGPVWLLPESLLDSFEVRGRGRPKKEDEAAAKKAAPSKKVGAKAPVNGGAKGAKRKARGA